MEIAKEYRRLSTLTLWEDNPRSITAENFKRLKKHIKKFGQYKPVLVNQNNIVLGGNMRLRAMKDLKIEDVWVSEVHTDTRAEMLEYAMSDNETFGDWDEQALAGLLTEEWVNLDVEDFKVDVGKLQLNDILDKFGPSKDDDLEDLLPTKKKIECPNCHFEFVK